MTLLKLKRVLWSSCLILTAWLISELPVKAIPESTSPPLSDASLLEPAPSTALQPRVSAGYNSSGGGYDAFANLDGFFPLWQTPGENLWYAQTRLAVDENSNLGGSLLFGYRQLSTSGNRVRGAYLAFDQRSTDYNTFQQIGFGLEQLGDIDLRLNGYLPIGSTRKSTVNTGLQLKDLYFSDHYLNLVLEQQQIYEAAAKGLDFEIGTRLASLGTGELRGHAGLYYYDPPGANGALGYRVRLAANPHPNVNMGLNFQADPLFGSQLSFQIGASWGGNKRRNDENTVLARLAESVQRTGTIVIDTQTETSFSGTVLATNPETGQPWYFLHVKPGSTTGGEFETPYGLVEDAIAVSPANQNTIIYVQDVNTPTGAITVPENVRLWSTGPLQQINTNEFSLVTLPLSNSGVFPSVVDTLTMSNGSHLAGFTITPPSGNDAVSGNGVGDIIVRENRITTIGNNADGVSFLQGTNSLSVLNNQITTSGDSAHGVVMFQTTANIADATITDNTINTQGSRSNGVNMFARGAAAGVTTINLNNNTISTTNTYASGLSIFADDSSVVGDIVARGNNIATNAYNSQGILAIAQDSAQITRATITDNQLVTGGNRGNGVLAFASNQATFGEATITSNRITTQNTNANGVLAFASNGGAMTQTTISGNGITTQNTGSAGLLAFASGCTPGACDGSVAITASSSLGTATITNNTIQTSNPDSEGILAFATRSGTLNTATITGNTVTTTGTGGTSAYNTSTYSGGILAFAANAATLNTTTISGNTVNTQGADSNGLAIFSVSNGAYGASSITTATVTGNAVTTAGNNANALMAFATNTSTLANAVLTGNTLNTTGANAHGVYGFASNTTNFNNAQISNSTVTTTGNQSSGIQIAARNNSQIASTTITGNTSRTTGDSSYGIALQAGNTSTLVNTTIQSNRIQTTNSDADGIAVNLTNNSTLTTGSFTNNNIQTQGNAAQGLSVLANSSAAGLSITSNTVTALGTCTSNTTCADGINILNLNGTLNGTTQISSNNISTSGTGGAGIATSANGNTATVNNLQITSNVVNTTGERYNNNTNALGINVSALNNSTVTSASVTSNTVNTQGEQAHGVQVLAATGTIASANVTQNTATTAGQGAHGIFALATQTNGEITASTIHSNTVTTTGTSASGIFALASNDARVESLSLLNNTLPQAGANSFLLLTSVAAATPTLTNAFLCIADFTGNTSSNPFDQDLRILHNTGELKFPNYTVPNIQAVNTGFTAITASGAVPSFNTAAGTCP